MSEGLFTMGCVEEKDNDMTYCCLDEALSLPFLMLMLSVYCTWKDNLTWPTLIEHLYDIVVLMSTYFHSYIPLFLVMFSTVLKTIKKKTQLLRKCLLASIWQYDKYGDTEATI